MAFDFTKLDGYKPDMSAEDKLSLLEKYEAPAPDLSGFIAKSAFDKTASELAEAKRQLKTKMTEDEQKEAERAASEAAIKAELEALRKDKSVTESKAQFLALGYDEKLAADTAKALSDGDMAKVFANQKTFVDNVKKAERAAALAGGSEPPPGKGAKTEYTKESFKTMSVADIAKLKAEQPEVFQSLTE